MPIRVALIDNYDSYTHNLAHLIAVANDGAPPQTVLADRFFSLAALTEAYGPFDAFVLSPGPGRPENPADFPRLERQILAANVPVLAVCLGHQALCHAFGASVEHNPCGPAHGVVSVVERAPTGHDCPLLADLPPAFSVVRYHSLHVRLDTPHAHLRPTAWTTDYDSSHRPHRVLMAVRHRSKPVFGLQFHPESVSSQCGHLIARNFIALARNLRSHPCSQPMLTAPRSRRRILRTLVEKRKPLNIEPQHVFSSLLAHRACSFWLDSSTADRHVPACFASVEPEERRSLKSISRCSSPGRTSDTSEADHPTTRPTQHIGRFSVMGPFDGPLTEVVTYCTASRLVTVSHANGITSRFRTTIFDYLQRALAKRYAPQHPLLPVDMNGGYVGYFGYELKNDSSEASPGRHRSSLPDAWFVFADRVLVFDHVEQSLYIVAVFPEEDHTALLAAHKWVDWVNSRLDTIDSTEHTSPIAPCSSPTTTPDTSALPLSFQLERSRSLYLDDVRQAMQLIHDGETYEVCLTNRLRATIPEDCKLDPFRLYCALRLVNPAPYSAFLRLDNHTAVCCSSPERFLRITSDGIVESKPIKGTLPRGRSIDEDEQLRLQLQNSPKDRSENLMIVDLVRNDLSRTCAVGSVRVPSLMNVESYATVHQLVSTVTAQLHNPEDAIQCVRYAYPMGSMTGAPKVRTMEIIDKLEHSARGVYSGSIGYLSANGAVNLNVVIRTAVIQNSRVEIGVGGAIVSMSSPEAEYDEVILKGRAIMQAVALQATGRSDYMVEAESEGVHRCDAI